MASKSILGLICRKIGPRSGLLGREFSSGGHEELLRPAAAASPWLMLPPSFTLRARAGEGFDMAYKLYSPIKGKVVSFSNRGGKEETDVIRSNDTVLVGSSHGWFAMFNTRTCDLFLNNPLSGRRIDLPPLPGKPFPPGDKCLPPRKLIISCSPDDEQDCRALVIPGSLDRVAICRPGHSDVWLPLPLDECPAVPVPGDLRFYVDFVYSAARSRFFGLVHSKSKSGWCFEENLEGWEISIDNKEDSSLCQRMDRFNRLGELDTDTDTNTETKTNKRFPSTTSYLVYDDQSDQLFLVRRYEIHRETIEYDVTVKRYLLLDREKIDYDVYRIDNDGGIDLCSSLDDLVMFLGINHSFALKASEFPELKPNSIYFSDAWVHISDDITSQTIEIFDYQNKSCSPVYYPSRHQNNRVPMPWFTPTSDN